METTVADLAAKAGKPVDEIAQEAVTARYPISIGERVHDVEEVANLVAYLCSPLASATTGSALRADGGIVETLA